MKQFGIVVRHLYTPMGYDRAARPPRARQKEKAGQMNVRPFFLFVEKKEA
jgi:hypothetical protein